MSLPKLVRGFGVALAVFLVGVVPVSAQSKRSVAQESARLAGGEVPAAKEAARALGETRGSQALDALLDGLAMGLHPEVAAVALEAVGQHGAARSVDVLLAYASHRVPAVRAAAVEALGRIDDPRSLTAYRRALRDGDESVRAAAARTAQRRKDGTVTREMLALLERGDEAMVEPLGALATPDVARRVAELIGKAPDALVAHTLGRVLLRKDMGNEAFYVELVRAVGKVPGDEGIVVLTEYISEVPESPPRQSRREAQAIVEQRMEGASKGGTR